MIDPTLYAVRIHDTDDETEKASVIFAESYDGPWYDMATGETDYCWEIVTALRKVQRPTLTDENQNLESRLHHAAADSMMWDPKVGEAIDQALAEIAKLRLENSDYRTRVHYLTKEISDQTPTESTIQ